MVDSEREHRKPYEVPRLARLGSLASLTRSVPMGGAGDGFGMMDPVSA